MANTCGMLHPEIQKEYNLLSKQYIDKGISPSNARVKAAEDLYNDVENEVINRVLGSINNETTTAYTEVSNDVLNKSNIFTVFDKLNSLGNKQDNISHSKHLYKVMNELVIPLNAQLENLRFVVGKGTDSTIGEYTSEGFKREILVVVGGNPTKTTLELSAQEVAAHEFVHAITERMLKHGSYPIRKGIKELFNIARDSEIIKQGLDQKTYDYIFNGKNPIDEFVAYGITNETVRSLLDQVIIKKDKAKPTNLKESLYQWYERFIDWITNKVLHIEGDNVTNALYNLTYDLVGLKNKHKGILDYLSDSIEFTKKYANKTIDQILKPLFENESSNKVLQTIRGFKHLPKLMKVLKFTEALGKVSNNLIKHKQFFLWNLMIKLPQELVGLNPTSAVWHEMLRMSKALDGVKQRIREATISNIRGSFRTDIDDKDKEDLYWSLLKTDADDLITYSDGKNDWMYIKDVMSNETKLNKEIDSHIRLLQSKFGNFIGNIYINQADGLGMYMVRKETFIENAQFRNPTQIASYSYSKDFEVPDNWKEAVPIIARLKSLYAIKYSNEFVLKNTVDILTREFESNSEENGITTIVYLNAQFKQQTLDQLFDGNPILMDSGYTADINDPSIMIKISNDPEDKELLDLGYEFKGALSKSPADVGPKRYIYRSAYNGLVPYNKSIASLTSKQLSGTTLSEAFMSDGMGPKDAHTKSNNITHKLRTNINLTKLSTLGGKRELNSFIPLTNELGQIIDYRYMMKESTRIELLGRDTKVDQVLGAMFESISDKVSATKINNAVVKEIINEFDTLYTRSAKGFITIDKNHPKFNELYQVFPKEMRHQLDLRFGKDRLVIRESMLDIIFGFRKYSVTTDAINSYAMKTLKVIYTSLGGSVGGFMQTSRRVEQGFQELIQEIKTTIILKTESLLHNILSNNVILLMHGIPLSYVARKQGEALLAIEDYTKQVKERLITQQKLNYYGVTPVDKKNLEGKLLQLDTAIKNSPIKELVEQGLLNSIVEDTSIEDTDFGIKQEFLKAIVNRTKWLPKPIKTAYDITYLTKKTAIYSFLEKTTRYSDFIARYAMYEWYTKEQNMPKEEALKIAIETFVNYDLPTSRELQYLNDMGLWMFTKYALRIQKAIYRLLRDNPRSIIPLWSAEWLLNGNIPDPTDTLSFMFGLPSNPLNSIDLLVAPGVKMFEDVTGINII